MLNGELTPRSNLIGELTGGIFYGTNDYEELINKPSINGVELKGNKTTSDLGINIPTELSELTNDVGFITSADVPTKTSELTNDSGFITSADVPTATSELVNDSGFITSADIPAIPTKTSELTNDSGFITSAAVPSRTSQLVNDSGFITSADIPTDVSAFTNDAGYITSADIPTDVSAFTNDAGYISNSDLMTATASGSIATFSNGGDDIPVKAFECEIVAQQASGTPTPSSPLPITGFSQADITVTDNDQISNVYTVAFGQTIYGGRLIYANGEWSIEATFGYVDLGSLSWTYDSGNARFYSSDLANVIKLPTGYYEKMNGKCEIFNIVEAVNWNTNLAISLFPSGALFVVDSNYTDATAFTSAVNGHLLTYELATPTIISITSSTRVKTISGDNNIYSNTGDCELEYFTNKADSIAELIKAFVL